MNIQKLYDFSKRLQQAHDDAVKRGDAAGVQRYGQLIDEVGKHVQEVQQGQQGPQGTPGAQGVAGQAAQPAVGAKVNLVGGPQPMDQMQAAPMSVPQQASNGAWDQLFKQNPTRQMIQGVPNAPAAKYAGPAGEPPDIQREAMQEAGGSWLDSLFSGAKKAHGVITGIPSPTNPAPVIPTDPDFMYKPLWGDHDLLFNQREQKNAVAALTGNRWFLNDPKSLGAGQVPGTGNFDKAPQSNGEVDPEFVRPVEQENAYNFEATDPVTKQETLQRDRYDELLKGLGKSPANMNWVDAVGLLLGGNNYLKFKAEQVRDYENKRFEIGMAGAHAQSAHQDRKDNSTYQQQKLAVELMKNQADERQKADSMEQSAVNNLVHSIGGSISPETIMKNDVIKKEAARQEARRQQILQQQRAAVEKGN